MKQFKSTGVLFFLVALVVGYAYFFEYKGKTEKAAEEAQAKKIIPFSLEDISEFTIKTATSEHQFKKEKRETGAVQWMLEKPVKDIASYAAVQSFLSQFGQEAYEDIAAEGTGVDFSIYGLNENPGSFSFTRKHDGLDQTLTIEVGTASAIGGNKYLRLSKQDKVLIAGPFWEVQLQKNFSDLREKNFIDPNFEIEKIVIVNKESQTFEQKDGKWVLNELKTQDPDQVAIDNVYYQLKNLKASQILKEGKADQDLKNLGLQEPAIKITVLGKSDKKIDLSFSRNIANQVYAISGERNVIFSLNPPAVKPFEKLIEDYRDKKKPLSFNLADVEEVDFKSSLTSFKLKKQDSEWKSIEALSGMEVDNSKVVDILSKLSMMKVKKYFDREISYQKSGMSELILKTSKGDKLLELEWSPRPIEDVFVGKSNLSEKTFGLSMEDVGSLPFQAVIKETPKVEEKDQGKTVQ